MKHGATVALLDLHPWGDCNEDALVEEYVFSAPGYGKVQRKRRIPANSASVLFNNGGPEITGTANMNTIATFEKEKAEQKAEEAAKKATRTKNKVKKRQDATQAVVNMVIQELLAAKNPPRRRFMTQTTVP